MPDPIHEENGLWYFWDETWSDRNGPYPTRRHAEADLIGYCLNYLGNYPPDQETRLRAKLAVLMTALATEDPCGKGT